MQCSRVMSRTMSRTTQIKLDRLNRLNLKKSSQSYSCTFKFPTQFRTMDLKNAKLRLYVESGERE